MSEENIELHKLLNNPPIDKKLLNIDNLERL